MAKNKPAATFSDIESALRAALSARTAPKAKGAHKQRPSPGHHITVIVNSRPANLVGPNVFTVVTVETVSRFEAELEALKQARKAGLRHSVIISHEAW